MDYSEYTYEELIEENNKWTEKYNIIEEKCIREKLPFSEFQIKAQEEKEKLYFISKYMRLKQNPTITYGTQTMGEKRPFEQFVVSVKTKNWDDDMGYGLYASEDGISDVIVKPSDIIENIYRNDFSFVVWYEQN